MELHTKEVHFSNVVLALLFVLAGVVLLFWPIKTMEICCQFIGSIVIFYGITRFYMYYKPVSYTHLYQRRIGCFRNYEC